MIFLFFQGLRLLLNKGLNIWAFACLDFPLDDTLFIELMILHDRDLPVAHGRVAEDLTRQLVAPILV